MQQDYLIVLIRIKPTLNRKEFISVPFHLLDTKQTEVRMTVLHTCA
jgi:hypothetical protein